MIPIRFQYDQLKAVAAIRFLAESGISDLTKGKVNKLLFLADKLHLVRFGRPITGDWYAAMQHGPVPSQIDNLMDALESGHEWCNGYSDLSAEVQLNRNFQYPRILPGPGESETPHMHLSDSDLEALQEIVERYGNRSFTELRSLTHEMPAYVKAWAERTGSRGDMAFEDFFEEDENAIAGVREEAIENCRLHSQFPEPAWD